MRCLITGVAGFIGSHLAERLLAEGHEVIGLDIFTDYYPRVLKERNLAGARTWRHFTFLEADLLTYDLLPALSGVDWVFHQAAQAGVRASWGRDFASYVKHNISATQYLLEAVRQVGSVQRFIYASSSSVYGDATVLPVTETQTPLPVSPYGVTKLTGEHLCHLYYQTFGLPMVILRYFTVYGARQRPDMAFYRFCQAALKQQPITVYGDGSQTRDFTHVADVVEANLQAARTTEATGRVMNIAGGARVPLRDVLQLLEEITGSPVQVIYDEKQPGDVVHTYADTRQAAAVLGYQPHVTLRAGLADEFDFVRGLAV
jgi:nucleoside-diphosphate-sugar epimerase